MSSSDGSPGCPPFARSSRCFPPPTWRALGPRSVLNLFRAIDALVYALIFVAAVGLGPFSGVLAVVAYIATVLAKLYSEAIESIDPGPMEAVAAAILGLVGAGGIGFYIQTYLRMLNYPAGVHRTAGADRAGDDGGLRVVPPPHSPGLDAWSEKEKRLQGLPPGAPVLRDLLTS